MMIIVESEWLWRNFVEVESVGHNEHRFIPITTTDSWIFKDFIMRKILISPAQGVYLLRKYVGLGMCYWVCTHPYFRLGTYHLGKYPIPMLPS